MSYAVEVLYRCSSLATLVLHLRKPPVDHHARTNLPHITLGDLRTARIHFDALDGSAILDYLTASALQSLGLTWAAETPKGSEPHSGVHVSRLLGRSLCRLHHLSLRNVPASERRCANAAFRGLRALEIHVRDDVPLTDDDFIALSAISGDGSPELLKDMKEFSIAGPGRYQGATVLGMYEARRAAGYPLDVLVLDIELVDHDYFGDYDTVERIRHLEPKAEVYGDHVLWYRDYERKMKMQVP